MRGRRLECELASQARLMLSGHRPWLACGDDPLAPPEAPGLEGWTETLRMLLQTWID